MLLVCMRVSPAPVQRKNSIWKFSVFRKQQPPLRAFRLAAPSHTACLPCRVVDIGGRIGAVYTPDAAYTYVPLIRSYK